MWGYWDDKDWNLVHKVVLYGDGRSSWQIGSGRLGLSFREQEKVGGGGDRFEVFWQLLDDKGTLRWSAMTKNGFQSKSLQWSRAMEVSSFLFTQKAFEAVFLHLCAKGFLMTFKYECKRKWTFDAWPVKHRRFIFACTWSPKGLNPNRNVSKDINF